jgi:uncharacterized protein (TIGR02996 family)
MSPVDERRALMAAIIANPDEDTPRLALADWLDEHGDAHDRARAEFIRCQITAARGGPDAKKAEKRASALRSKHYRHWLGPIVRLPQMYLKRHPFSRGIYGNWSAAHADFLTKAYQAAVCAQFPLLGVECLMLYDRTKRVEAFAQSPALAWVASLIWYYAQLGDSGLRALAQSPHLGRLARLVLDRPQCTNAGLQALAESKGFANLRALAIRCGGGRDRYTAAGMCAILDSANFPRLDELDLSGAVSAAVANRHFFASKSLARLRVLKLGFRSDTKALARCPHLTNLEELHTSELWLADDDARALAENPALARVKVLKLCDYGADQPPPSAAAEGVLRARFGDGFVIEYVQVR